MEKVHQFLHVELANFHVLVSNFHRVRLVRARREEINPLTVGGRVEVRAVGRAIGDAIWPAAVAGEELAVVGLVVMDGPLDRSMG